MRAAGRRRAKLCDSVPWPPVIRSAGSGLGTGQATRHLAAQRVGQGGHHGTGSYTVNRSSCSHLWRLGVLLAGLAAMPATWADPLSAVEVLREGGCGGIMPAAPPLRHNPMLDRAAAEWAMGQSLPVASERNGYRGDFTAGLHISGPDSATLQLLRRSGCRIVAGREMRDIGVYRRGFDTWIVVGSSYRLPPGLQASTGTWMPPPAPPQVVSSAAPTTSPPSARVMPSSPPPYQVGTLPGTLAPAHVRAGTQPPSAPASHCNSGAPLCALLAQATRALQLVNDVRARGTHCGDELFGPAPPVTLSGTLADVALGHASDMAEKNYFEHVDPGGPIAGGSGSRGRLLGKAGRRKYRLRPEVGRRSGAGLARQSRPLREHHGSALR